MAHLQLAGTSFRQRAAERRVIEDRVVSESAASLRGGRYRPLDCSERLAANLRAISQRDSAHEPGGPVRIRSRREHAVDQCELVFVRAFDSAETRRLDARR